jgi:hypothetical protein
MSARCGVEDSATGTLSIFQLEQLAGPEVRSVRLES